MEQVGVKAPGTEISTTFFPAKISSVESDSGPLFPITVREPWGIFSPAEIAILVIIFSNDHDKPIQLVGYFNLAG